MTTEVAWHIVLSIGFGSSPTHGTDKWNLFAFGYFRCLFIYLYILCLSHSPCRVNEKVNVEGALTIIGCKGS